jgi:NTP pyrophosphatase (non-canonical NTP hydrolase)
MSNLHLKDSPTLSDYQQYAIDMVKERGFEDNVQQRFMLLLEEAGELAKAARGHTGMKFAADTKQKEVEEEAADVFIVLLAICNLLGVDLEKAFREKEERNKQRVWK